MTANIPRRTCACLVLGTIAMLALAPAGVRAGDANVEPEATRILKGMTDTVGGLGTFSLDTDNMIEEVMDTGQKIMYDFTTSITVQRPNKIRAERMGDLFQQVIAYNGKTLAIHNIQDNYYATSDAPDNIDDTLHFARETLDIVPPSGDMVFTNAFELLTASITSGAVVGKSMVGGVRCDHLAFTSPLVDWQIWISDGETPLPYKYVLTTKDDPAQPQYIMLMSNWNTAPKVNDAMFDFTPPEGAQKVDFIRMDTK